MWQSPSVNPLFGNNTVFTQSKFCNTQCTKNICMCRLSVRAHAHTHTQPISNIIVSPCMLCTSSMAIVEILMIVYALRSHILRCLLCPRHFSHISIAVYQRKNGRKKKKKLEVRAVALSSMRTSISILLNRFLIIAYTPLITYYCRIYHQL